MLIHGLDYKMKSGMSKNSAGIGGKIEDLRCLGAFASSTGGSEIQRRIERCYGKVEHAAYKKEEELILPLFDISLPKRVF